MTKFLKGIVTDTLQVTGGTPAVGKVLTSDGSGNVTLQTPSGGMAIGGSVTSATTGSVLFAGASGVLAQDNANIFFDDTNNRLGIGTATPGVALDILTTTNNSLRVQSNHTTATGIVLKNTSAGGEGWEFYAGGTASPGLFGVYNQTNDKTNLAIAGLSGNQYLRSGSQYAWSTAANYADSTGDTGLARSAAGVVKVTNASTGRGSLEVLDEVYGASWDASLQVPTKNAVYDKIQAPSGDVTLTGTQTLTNKTLTSPILTTPAIGVATGTSLETTGALTSSGTAGMGYTTGAGGTVTQITSKSTGVTLNKITGTITMQAAALAAATIVSFTVTNSTIAATDNVILSHVATGTVGSYLLNASTIGAGSFIINVRNTSAGSLSEAIQIRFTIIKSVNA